MKVDRSRSSKHTGRCPLTRAQQAWNCRCQPHFPESGYSRALLRVGVGALRSGSLTRTWGMGIVEMLVALGLSTMVLGGIITLFLASVKNFTGMGNYASLTNQSRQSM